MNEALDFTIAAAIASLILALITVALTQALSQQRGKARPVLEITWFIVFMSTMGSCLAAFALGMYLFTLDNPLRDL